MLMALRKGRKVLSLGIDYGQRHRIELEYARHQCEKFGCPRKILRVEWDKPILHVPLDRKIEKMRRSISPAFLPARNAVFLTLACAEAAGFGAREVWIGANVVDYSGYPDCRPEFISAFQKMIRVAVPGGPKILAPLLHMTKPQIARKAHQLGLRRGDTWSCYQPVISVTGIQSCGRCDACVLHRHAWDHGVSTS